MITLVVIWIVWCALHSLLISRAAHDAARKILGPRFQLYRLYYVGFSLVSLVPVLWYQLSLPSQLLVDSNLAWRIGQVVLLVYAGCMFYAGARAYDMGYFIGLSQWRSFRKQKESDSLPFHSNGVLAYVRHPWYSGGIALLWGLGSCTDVYLVTRSVLTVYFVVGTVLEEIRLTKELGEQYIAYCRKVPMLIPWKIPAGKTGARKSY